MQGKPHLLPCSVIRKQSTATATESGNDQGREEKFTEKLESPYDVGSIKHLYKLWLLL